MALPTSNKQTSNNVSVQNQRLKSSSASGNSSQKENENQSPFLSSPFGHHGFLPQKLGKGPSAETKLPKPPKPPEKPLMPYMRYSRKVWDQVKAQNPESKLWEIGKIIGQMWRDLPSDDKTGFVEEYDAEKVEYEKNLKLYYNSPAYLAYIAGKPKGKSAQQAGEDRDLHDSSTAGSKQDRKIEIQPAKDDDDAEETYSIKHLSYGRYLRNHYLIHEIFSDTVVPDVRTVITSSRMQNFYCKIQSLKKHQKKMESEVEQLVEKFERTKRQLNESSDAFQEEIQKYCKRAVDEDYFNEMVEKEYERLRRERLSTNNNNIPLDDGKKDTGQFTPLCDTSSISTDVFPDPLASTSHLEEVAVEAKQGDDLCDQDKNDTFPTPPVPAITTFQSSTQYTTHPHLSFASGYNQTCSTVSQNQMPPPPSVQPFFSSPQSPNILKTQYSYPLGLPQYSASQNAHAYYPSLPYQQHQVGVAQTTQQRGSAIAFQMAPHSENRDDAEETPSSISPE